jgi:HSP20 family protein
MITSLERRSRRPSWLTPFGSELFFDRFWPEWRTEIGEEWSPAINFSEKDGKYYLTADIPGMKKEDISVSVENGYLTVSGRKEETKEEKEANYYMKETLHGSFSRSLRLPEEVDEAKIEAFYKDGVLSVTIEKSEKSGTRKIEIH